MNRDALAQAYLSRLDANPQDLGAIFALEALYAQAASWQALVQALFGHAESSSDDLVRARLLLEASRLAHLRLNDVALAAELLERAFALCEQDTMATEARILALVLQQSWGELEQLFGEADAQLAQDTPARARLYVRMGNVLEDVLQDADQAAQMYRYAQDLDPSSSAGLIRLQGLALKSQDWPTLGGLLLQELNVVEDATRQVELMLALGQLYLEQLNLPAEALQCFQNVYEYNPQEPRAIAGLKALGADQGVSPHDPQRVDEDSPEDDLALEQDEGAQTMLEELEPAQPSAPLQAAPPEPELAVEAQAQPEPEPEPEPAVELAVEAAQETAAPDDIEDDSPADEAPAEEPAPEDESPEAPALTWQERVRQLLQLAQSSADAQEQRALIARAARKAWVNDAQDEAIALEIWRAALACGQAQALYDHHHFRYEGAALWAQLMGLVKRQGATSVEAHIALFKAQDVAAATALIEAAGLGELKQIVDDLGPAQEDWRKFQRTVEGRYPELERDARNVVVYTYLSRVAEALGDAEKGFDMLRRLDRLSEELSIKGQLQVAYRDQEKWPAYVDLLKQEAASLPADAVEDKIDLWRASIRVYTELMRNDMQAINLYKEVLELDPSNIEAIDDLIALYEKNNRTSDQITMLQQKAGLVQRRATKIALLSEVATLYLDKFRNQAEAIKTYEEILELDGRHEAAVAFLKDMYEKRREWEKLIALHERELERLKGASARQALLKATAQIAADKLRKPEVAAAFWQRALDEAPQDMECLDALEALYEKAREYEPLSVVLERKVSLLTSPADQMKLYQKLGLLFSNHIHDPSRAILAWRGALALEPEDRKARMSLENLYVEHQRWEELEGFYGQSQAWSELAKLLESLVNKQQEDAVKVELLLRAGRVARAQLGDIQRAERALDRIHQQLDPRHEGAARELELIYEQQGQHDKQLHVAQIILSHLSQPEQRRPVQLKLAQLSEGPLADASQAFAWRAQIVEEDITRQQDILELERVAALADAWPLVVQIYERALERAQQDVALHRELRMRLGLVLANALGHYERAQGCFESILAEAPSHDGALAGMEHIFRHQRRWDDLLGVYQRRLELVEEPAKRVQILHGMAELAEQQAKNIPVALSKYQEAYGLDATHEPTLIQLHRLYAMQGQIEALAQIIREEIALVDARRDDASDASDASDAIERAVELRYELGALCMQQLDRPEEAVEAFGQALERQPEHALALESLELMLEGDLSSPLRARIGQIVAPVYEAYGRWEALIMALKLQADDPRLELQARVALIWRVAQVYLEQLGQGEPAFEHAAQALTLDPTQAPLRQLLKQLAQGLEDWGTWVARYEQAIIPSANAHSAALGRDYQFELAQVYREQLQDFVRAEDVYQLLLDDEDGQPQALAQLEQLYTQTEQWRSLIDVYKRQIKLTQEAALIEALQLKIAQTWEGLLEQPKEAISVYRQILAASPADARVMRELERLYRQQGRFQELVEHLEHEQAQTPAEHGHLVKHRMAEVYELHLGDVERAVDLYEEILTEHRLHDDAMYSLERVMRSAHEQALRASALLEPRYEETEDVERLMSALYVQVERSPQASQRLALLHRIAALAEHQAQDASAAFAAYGRSLQEDPELEQTLQALERLAEQTSEWSELAQVYEQAAAQASQPAQRRDLLRRAAATYVNRLGDVDATCARLVEAVEAMPEDLESIDDLLNLYQHLEQWAEYAQMLRRKASIVLEGELKKTLLLQASTVYVEFVALPHEAIEANRELLEVFPSDEDALANLERLYTQLERWEQLLEVFQIRLELAQDVDQRKALLVVIAAIYKLHMKQPLDAIEFYERALELDAEDLSTLVELDELYEQTEQWDELLTILERQIERSTQLDERLALQYRVGQLWQHRREDYASAIEVYRTILGVDAAHEATTQALEEIIAQRPDFALDAAQVLQPIYEDLERWDELIHVYRLRAQSAEEPEQQLELLREIANIEEGCKEDRAAAFQTYAAVLALDATREDALEKLTQLAAAIGAWDAYIDTLDAIIDERQGDVVVGAALQRSVAAVYAGPLDDAGAAIDRYVRVLELDPVDERSLEQLDGLYQAQGKWQELSEVLRQRVELTADGALQVELRLRLATLYRAMLERPEEALEVLRAVLLDEPDNASAIEALEGMFMDGLAVQAIAEILEPHYLSRQQHDSLIALYRQRLEHLAQPQERYDLLRQIARIYAQELQDELGALAHLGEALVELPGDEALMQELDELAQRQQAWGELTGYYVRALERQELEPATSLQMWLRLAQMIDERLGSPESAEVAYANALVFDPADATALAALDRIFEQQQRWEELDQTLARRIEHTTDLDDLVLLYLRRGDLNKEVLLERELAVSCFHEVLKREPEHLDALKALEQLYISLGQFEPLYEVLRAQSALTLDGQEQAGLLRRMAGLCEDHLARRDEAMALLGRVIELQPDDLEALSLLRRLYLMEERWEDMVTIIEMEIDLTQEDEERLGLYENLGVIWRDRIQDETRALEAWQNALSLDAQYLPALEALRDIFAVRGDYVELSSILERMIANPELEPERRLDLWIELADTQGTVLMEHERAIIAWQNVLLLNPGDRRAIDSLELLYDQEERWEELVGVLEVKADNIEDPEQRLDILRKLADRCANRVQDKPRAAQYLEQILEIVGYDEQAYAWLESIYQELDTDESLSSLVDLYLSRAEQVAEDPEQRTQILRRATTLFEQRLGSLPSAFVVLLSALTGQTAHDEDLVGEIERLAQANHEAGQPVWVELINHYAQVLQSGQVVGRASFMLHWRIGDLLAGQLDQPEDAVFYLQRALQDDPQSVAALVRLEQLYQQLASWPELVQTMRARQDLVEDLDEKVSLWREIGALYEGQLVEIDQAVFAYEQILAIDESDVLAMESLERIYQAYERWEELVDILRQRARFMFDPDQLVALRHQIARVFERELRDEERALSAYNEVLEADGSDMAALQALEGLYRGMGRWPQVLACYQRQLELLSDPHEQIFIYSKIATDQEEQLQDVEEAIQAYVNILSIDAHNEVAVENLERLYAQTRRWFDLVDIMEAHVQLVQSVPQRARLLYEIARVQRDELRDAHAAIDAMVRSLGEEPSQEGTLQELAALYEQTEQWEAAIAAYGQRIQLVYDMEWRVALCYRIAELYETQLHHDAYAEQSYREGLKLDPGHRPTLEALRALYERQFNWQGVIQIIKQLEQTTRDLSEKAVCLAQIGRVYEDRLDDMVSAIRYYEQAQELDPSRIDAAEPLIDVYMRERRYERALPLLRKVVQDPSLRERDVAARHLRVLQMAQTCEELGLFQEALNHYHQAYELDPTSLEGLAGFGRQLYRHDDVEASLKIYQSLQLQHLERLDATRAHELFFHCGMIKQRVGEQRRAVEYFEQALEYDPNHKETIQALLENYEGAQLWDRFIQMQLALTKQETDAKLKLAQLTRVGDVLLTKLNQEGQAAQAYLQALDVEPKSVIVLRKLLDLYTKLRRWPEAVEMLERLIAIEPDPSKQSKLAYTIAVIFRDEVQDPRRSLEYFDRALELDVNLLKAFEAINRIHTEMKDWKGLERAYRAMLKRIAQQGDGSERFQSVNYMLWEGLGEIYRSRLNHLQSAIQAFEMASEINPNSEKVHRILAELYDLVQDADGAVRHHRRIIENDPFKIESYRALFKAYAQKKAYDRAWCMASALSFLQQANETEERFYQEYLGSNLKAAKRTFTPDSFRLLYHGEQDMFITAIMQQLNIVYSPAYAKDPKDLGLNKKKDLLDPNKELHFCKVYSYIASRLAPVGLVPTPAMYQRLDQAIGMRNANTLPPSFLIGADMLQGRDERELAFLVAKRLGWMMSQHYLGSCGYPTEWLKAFFMAAMHITDPSLGIDRQLGESGPGLLAALEDAERMSPGIRLQIQKLMRQFLDSGRNPNLSHWLTCVDHTTSRLGLLICGDLKKAVVGIKNDPLPVGKANIKDKIRELVLFSISEEYFTLREQLGLAIGT